MHRGSLRSHQQPQVQDLLVLKSTDQKVHVKTIKTNSVMSDGVLYIASGEQYIKEATLSVNSVKNHMPDVETAIVTDDKINVSDSQFDTVLDLSKSYPHTGISTIQPGMSPFDRTLFLDSDTYITEPVYELFDVVESHDIAFTLSPGRKSVPGLPDPWIEFNTGVVAYSKSASMDRFFHEWQEVHEQLLNQEGIERNQPSFTHAIHNYEPDYFVLSREYNCRVPRHGYLAHDAKIVHGRCAEPLEQVANKLNTPQGRRVYKPTIDRKLQNHISVIENSRAYRLKRLAQMANDKYTKEGLKSLISDGSRFVWDTNKKS